MNLRNPPDLPTLRAALWTVRAVRDAKRQLREGESHRALTLPPPPPLPPAAERGVRAALRRSRSTCLVQASVRQRWHAAHGDHRDLVIGVTPPADGFKAHAWLDGDPESRSDEFTELSRVRALRPGAAP